MEDRDFLNLSTKVDSNTKDIAQFSVLVTKMDAAIERLTDLTSNVAKLLAVHEERFENHQKVTDDVVSMLETRRRETEEKIGEVYEHIDREIDRLKEDEIAPIKETVDNLQKVAWSFGGGGVVVGTILGWIATHYDAFFKTVKSMQ